MDGDGQRKRNGDARVSPHRPFAEAEAPHSAPPPLDGDVDLALIVGRNLRRLRTQRGYSLGRLGEASGVSRAMLGQIELGRSMPTIGILWKIARALEVRFAALTAGSQAEHDAVIRVGETKVLISQDGRFSSRPLFPADGRRRVEFYQLRLAAGGIESAPPHPTGTIENLVVDRGAVEIDVETRRYRLDAGDAVLFEADVPHTYRNPSDGEAVMYLVMIYGDGLEGK